MGQDAGIDLDQRELGVALEARVQTARFEGNRRVTRDELEEMNRLDRKRRPEPTHDHRLIARGEEVVVQGESPRDGLLDPCLSLEVAAEIKTQANRPRVEERGRERKRRKMVSEETL